MYTLYMITNVAILAAVRTAPCGFTSVAAYLAAGKSVTKCRPSLRGMRRSQVVCVKPTRVVRSRG
jgi:hypothetical protein